MSAINATLFSSGYYAKGRLSQNLLPDQFGDTKVEGIPSRTLIILAIITATFSAYGSVDAITSFASLAFIIIFGSMSYLAFRQSIRSEINSVIPAIGLIGSIGFFFLMFLHLFNAEPSTFYSVVIIATIVITVELLYFERDILKQKNKLLR